MSLDLVGPFQERRVILDGWQVPLIQAWEVDGGEVCVVCDAHAFTVPAGEAENILRLVAHVIAQAWGYSAHPRFDEEFWSDRRAVFAPTHDKRRRDAFTRVRSGVGRVTDKEAEALTELGWDCQIPEAQGSAPGSVSAPVTAGEPRGELFLGDFGAGQAPPSREHKERA